MKSLLMLASAGSLLFGAGAAKAVDSAQLDVWLKETIGRNHIVGLSAVVIDGGKTVFARCYGTTNTVGGPPVDNRHIFHMASVSKAVVAVAMMQLYEAGKIELDAPVSRYLPYFTMADDRLDGVTIRRLLSHTSGMPDVDEYGFDQPEHDEGSLERWVRAQAGKSLLFEPGTDHAYSNIGFDILGDVIAKVSGQPFEAYMKQHVLLPLGLKDSSFFTPEIPAGKRLTGYTGAWRPYAVAHYPYNRRHAPSSTLQMSPDDLARWLMVFSNPARVAQSGILKAETLQTMWTVVFAMSDSRQVTHGWSQHVTDTGTILRHGGWDDGFRAEMAVYRDRDLGYGFMTNLETAPVDDIAKALRLAAADQPLPPVPVSAAVTAGELFDRDGTAAVLAYFKARMAEGDRAAGYGIYSFGLELSHGGQYAAALELATGMAELVPDHPLLTFRLAQALYDMGDKEAAFEAAKASLALDPERSDARKLIETIEAGQ